MDQSNMNTGEIKREIVEKINEYFARRLKAEDLFDWAIHHPHFVTKNTARSADDLIIDTALATMIILGEEPTNLHASDEDLRIALDYLTGERPFPEKETSNSGED